MPLQKEIELPLFRRGIVPSSTGVPVPFTDELLRRMERNTNYIIRAKLLQAPIKIAYDHPVADARKEAHGVISGARYDGGTLFIRGTNWSDALVADIKRGARLAYSGEFTENFSYPDPELKKTVSIGPAIVGLAMLGADRPAVKGLTPLNSIEFAEDISPVDAYETREELRKAGLVAEHAEGTHYFGEIENDTRRFAETEQETAMTPEELQKIADMMKTTVDAAVAPLKAEITSTKASIAQFSEQGKREQTAHQFCEALNDKRKDKAGPLPPVATAKLKDILSDSELTAGLAEKVRSFAESIPAIFVGKGTEEPPDDEDELDAKKTPNLLKIRKHHFAERDQNANLISDAIDELRVVKPDLFKDAKTVEQQIEVTRSYVAARA